MKGPVLTGKVLGGRYQLGELLGEGGYGAVYAAMQTDLGRPVAVKVLHIDAALQNDGIARFEREARAAAALGHPNIAAVTDFQANPGEPPFLVMERLAGRTMASALTIVGRLPPQRVAWIAYQILAALEAAHAAGIIHRDVKPDNVFLVSAPGVEDLVKLLDFGIAKLVSEDQKSLTAEGSMLGSPAYMAPEQVHGTRIDHRADLYAVGATMYRALSGRFPFDAANVHQLLLAIASAEPAVPLGRVDPSIPAQLAAVVERAMQKEPSRRFQTASEMRAALEPLVSVSGGRPVISGPGTAIMPSAPTPPPQMMHTPGPTPQPHVIGPTTQPGPPPQLLQPVQPVPAPAPKGNGAVIALLVVILLLLLGGGAAAAFFVYRSSAPAAAASASASAAAPAATSLAAIPSGVPAAPVTVAPGGAVVPKGGPKPVGPAPSIPAPDAGAPHAAPAVAVVDAGAPQAAPKGPKMGGTNPECRSGVFGPFVPSDGMAIVTSAPGLARCYQETELDPPEHSSIVMTMSIDAAGHVKSAKPKTDASFHPKLTPCVVAALEATHWPITQNGGDIDVGIVARPR